MCVCVCVCVCVCMCVCVSLLLKYTYLQQIIIKLDIDCLPGLIQSVLYQSIASKDLKAMKVLKIPLS